MNNVILDNRDHYQRIWDLLDMCPSRVSIATFSVGVTTFQTKVDGYDENTKNLLGVVLDKMHNLLQLKRIKEVRIITNEVQRTVELKKEYPQFKIRQHNETHAKAWIFQFNSNKTIALVGSRNMVSTPWAEITVEIYDNWAIPVRDMFDGLWVNGTDLDGQQDWFSQISDLTDEDLGIS